MNKNEIANIIEKEEGLYDFLRGIHQELLDDQVKTVVIKIVEIMKELKNRSGELYTDEGLKRAYESFNEMNKD